MNKRATPIKIMPYKHAIELYKLYNSAAGSMDWLNLNIQQNFNARVNKFLQPSHIQSGKKLTSQQTNMHKP